jgi:hypothetical protein
MDTWFMEMIRTWLHVAVLAGVLFLVLAVILIAREWYLAGRYDAEQQQRLQNRLWKFTHGYEEPDDTSGNVRQSRVKPWPDLK